MQPPRHTQTNQDRWVAPPPPPHPPEPSRVALTIAFPDIPAIIKRNTARTKKYLIRQIFQFDKNVFFLLCFICFLDTS